MTAGIGLALGGGAARGLAHIGVLRVLGEEGVPITHLAGCSAGAVVGAAYLCGTLYRLEEMVLGLRHRDLVRYADVTFAGGVLAGEGVLDLLRVITRGLHFEDLGVPFAVVATDLETRSRVVLRSGDVAEALRAAIAVPGLFAPAQVGGRSLVDGGLVELVPVRTLHELRTGPVVAVDVSYPDVWTRAASGLRAATQSARRRWSRLYRVARDYLPYPSRALEASRQSRQQRGWNLVRAVLTAFEVSEAHLQQAAGCHEADLVVRPNVRGFHGHQFDRAADLIGAGRSAAEETLPAIRRLACEPAPVGGGARG
ncbi:MAG: patatin-like phospholipase family protein [Clostridia bacterium]|nr:patatin-like phospholipase family protein [Clostridia bacterium]